MDFETLRARKAQRRSGFVVPVIGVVGGIGSGKSLVSQAFADLGCGLIDSDQVAHKVLEHPAVIAQLVQWWGSDILNAQGQIERKKIARQVFGRPEEIAKLNALVHPKVDQHRRAQMENWASAGNIKAVIWDTPLLFEVGLDALCDYVVFVKVPWNIRLQRVSAARGWSEQELAKREKSQISLDKKEELSDYSVDNSGEVSNTLRQVHAIFSQILDLKRF